MTDFLDARALAEVQRNLFREEELQAQMTSAVEPDSSARTIALFAELLAIAGDARTLASRIEHVLGDERPLRIAVIGDYSAGKSSFINHLLGDDLLCPVRDDPTTSHVTVFGYGPVERIASRSDAGRVTKLTRDQYVEQVQASGKTRSKRKPRRFIVNAPIDVLRNIEILDTPGFNNLKDAGDTSTTENVLGEVDAVLFLVDVNSGTIPESGANRLRKVRKLLPQAPMRVMFTKSDTKAPGRLRALKDDCKQRHGDLFDGEVLAYSTHDLAARADLISRDEVVGLFTGMARERKDQAAQLLAHDIRMHFMRRGQMLPRCIVQLDELINIGTLHIDKAIKTREKIRERVDRVRIDMAAVYRAEVRDALRASFRVVEISGTGWLFKDARILPVAPGLPGMLSKFKSVNEMRTRLRAEIRRFLPDGVETALQCVDLNCSAATEETANKAGELIKAAFDQLCNKTYDFESNAQEKLLAALGVHCSAIAEALWQDWIGWIDGIYENIEEYCLTPMLEHSQERTRALRHLIDDYRGLMNGPVSTTREIA
jgi:GTPase Era involved in 16S rRNA processing